MPKRTSGAIYSGAPTKLNPISPSKDINLLLEKSVTFKLPLLSIIIFSGFKLR